MECRLQTALVDPGLHSQGPYLGLKFSSLQIHLRPQAGEEVIALGANGLGRPLGETHMALLFLTSDSVLKIRNCDPRLLW